MITYKIDYSIDYGEMRPLLGVDIYASGDHPSIAEPIPLIDYDDVAMADEGEQVGDDDDAIDGLGNDDGTNGQEILIYGRKGKDDEKLQSRSSSAEAEFDDVEMSDDGGSSDSGNDDRDYARAEGNVKTPGEHGGGGVGDRFGVFVDPQNVIAFLDRANINLDDRSVFYFLLSFPFYEHEWDIAGFLFNALFGDEDGDNIEDDEDEEIEDEIKLIRGNDVCLPCN
ncbi:hypothetical protein ACHAW5_003461 [Stephanodiscus triporus]|uniref:Uncharacterized protein n=1 Tax=Stephanodiscus triporus TaxID=2934178 RepID=A0ABD3NBM8_9STRA